MDREFLVLLLEGDALVGLDLSEALISAGYRVAGPATTLADADSILSAAKPDFAILELDPEDGDCIAFAQALRRSGVPFLIHSYYARAERPADDFRDAPWFLKPALPWDIVSALDELSLSNMRA